MGATFTIGRYSPSPDDIPDELIDTFTLAVGARLTTSTSISISNSSGCISGGGSSGSSTFSGLTSFTFTSISLLGTTMSAIFRDLTSSCSYSRSIRLCITKNRPTATGTATSAAMITLTILLPILITPHHPSKHRVALSAKDAPRRLALLPHTLAYLDQPE